MRRLRSSKIIRVICLAVALVFCAQQVSFAEIINLRSEGQIQATDVLLAMLAGLTQAMGVNANWNVTQLFMYTYVIPKVAETVTDTLGIDDPILRAGIQMGISMGASTYFDLSVAGREMTKEAVKQTAEEAARAALEQGTKKAAEDVFKQAIKTATDEGLKNALKEAQAIFMEELGAEVTKESVKAATRAVFTKMKIAPATIAQRIRKFFSRLFGGGGAPSVDYLSTIKHANFISSLYASRILAAAIKAAEGTVYGLTKEFLMQNLKKQNEAFANFISSMGGMLLAHYAGVHLAKETGIIFGIARDGEGRGIGLVAHTLEGKELTTRLSRDDKLFWRKFQVVAVSDAVQTLAAMAGWQEEGIFLSAGVNILMTHHQNKQLKKEDWSLARETLMQEREAILAQAQATETLTQAQADRLQILDYLVALDYAEYKKLQATREIALRERVKTEEGFDLQRYGQDINERLFDAQVALGSARELLRDDPADIAARTEIEAQQAKIKELSIELDAAHYVLSLEGKGDFKGRDIDRHLQARENASQAMAHMWRNRIDVATMSSTEAMQQALTNAAISVLLQKVSLSTKSPTHGAVFNLWMSGLLKAALVPNNCVFTLQYRPGEYMIDHLDDAALDRIAYKDKNISFYMAIVGASIMEANVDALLLGQYRPFTTSSGEILLSRESLPDVFFMRRYHDYLKDFGEYGLTGAMQGQFVSAYHYQATKNLYEVSQHLAYLGGASSTSPLVKAYLVDLTRPGCKTVKLGSWRSSRSAAEAADRSLKPVETMIAASSATDEWGGPEEYRLAEVSLADQPEVWDGTGPGPEAFTTTDEPQAISYVAILGRDYKQERYLLPFTDPLAGHKQVQEVLEEKIAFGEKLTLQEQELLRQVTSHIQLYERDRTAWGSPGLGARVLVLEESYDLKDIRRAGSERTYLGQAQEEMREKQIRARAEKMLRNPRVQEQMGADIEAAVQSAGIEVIPVVPGPVSLDESIHPAGDGKFVVGGAAFDNMDEARIYARDNIPSSEADIPELWGAAKPPVVVRRRELTDKQKKDIEETVHDRYTASALRLAADEMSGKEMRRFDQVSYLVGENRRPLDAWQDKRITQPPGPVSTPGPGPSQQLTSPIPSLIRAPELNMPGVPVVDTGKISVPDISNIPADIEIPQSPEMPEVVFPSAGSGGGVLGTVIYQWEQIKPSGTRLSGTNDVYRLHMNLDDRTAEIFWYVGQGEWSAFRKGDLTYNSTTGQAMITWTADGKTHSVEVETPEPRFREAFRKFIAGQQLQDPGRFKEMVAGGKNTAGNPELLWSLLDNGGYSRADREKIEAKLAGMGITRRDAIVKTTEVARKLHLGLSPAGLSRQFSEEHPYELHQGVAAYLNTLPEDARSGALAAIQGAARKQGLTIIDPQRFIKRNRDQQALSRREREPELARMLDDTNIPGTVRNSIQGYLDGNIDRASLERAVSDYNNQVRRQNEASRAAYETGVAASMGQQAMQADRVLYDNYSSLNNFYNQLKNQAQSLGIAAPEPFTSADAEYNFSAQQQYLGYLTGYRDNLLGPARQSSFDSGNAARQQAIEQRRSLLTPDVIEYGRSTGAIMLDTDYKSDAFISSPAFENLVNNYYQAQQQDARQHNDRVFDLRDSIRGITGIDAFDSNYDDKYHAFIMQTATDQQKRDISEILGRPEMDLYSPIGVQENDILPAGKRIEGFQGSTPTVTQYMSTDTGINPYGLELRDGDRLAANLGVPRTPAVLSNNMDLGKPFDYYGKTFYVKDVAKQGNARSGYGGSQIQILAAPKGEPQNPWVFQFVEGDWVGMPLVDRFESNKIRSSRLPPKFDSTIKPNRPLAVVFEAASDWNEAFQSPSIKATISSLQEHGYNVLVRIVYTGSDILDYLKQNPAQRKADVVIIGGHGNPQGIRLGDFKPRGYGSKIRLAGQFETKLSLGLDDGKLLSGVSNYVSDSARIILFSCSTSRGASTGADTIAALISRAVPRSTVSAPGRDVGIEKLIFTNNGEVFPLYSNGQASSTYRGGKRISVSNSRAQ